MVRTKIEIDVSALHLHTKSINIIIGSNTTTRDVIGKILEKFRLQESPAKFQFLALPIKDTGRSNNIKAQGMLGG